MFSHKDKILALVTAAIALSPVGLEHYSPRIEREPKKCILAGCVKMIYGNQLACCREHFFQYIKERKSEA
jgi:hypothetical protein